MAVRKTTDRIDEQIAALMEQRKLAAAKEKKSAKDGKKEVSLLIGETLFALLDIEWTEISLYAFKNFCENHKEELHSTCGDQEKTISEARKEARTFKKENFGKPKTKVNSEEPVHHEEQPNW